MEERKALIAEERELKRKLKRDKREAMKKVPKPVVICEKCGAIIGLNVYFRHLEKCNGVFYENKYERAKATVDVDKRKLQAKKSRQKAKDKKRNYVNAYKEEHGCLICQEHCYHVIDLHHLDPAIKDSTISDLVERGSMKRLLEEIDKCVCLCRNCHQKVTVGIIVLL